METTTLDIEILKRALSASVPKLTKDELAELSRAGEEMAVLVGIEIARRAERRPTRYSYLSAEQVTAALEGSEDEQRAAALAVVAGEFGKSGVAGADTYWDDFAEEA
jgi:hypothetical protein